MSPTMLLRPVRPWLVLLAVAAASSAQAQYKVVGPDGKVTYTDRAPVDTTAKVQPLRPSGTPEAPTAGGTSTLPFDLRQVVQRFPVTFYASKDCSGCEIGREMLRRRGIPYAEKTVESQADIAALNRLEGASELPVLRIGQQQLRGYNEGTWASYLDAAGYPRDSRLPPGYQVQAAVALTAPASPGAASAPAAASPTNPAPAAPSPPVTPRAPVPGEIRF
jgi:glutaredoxin